MTRNPFTVRKVLVTGALAAGASLGAAGIATAATSSSSNTSTGASSSSSAPAGARSGTAPPGGNPATLSHGPGETLLTGNNLAKAEAAAKTAVPGGTVIRAETDSSGVAPYEVHIKKTDGTYATVELSSSFQVVKTITGFGPGPAGRSAPMGMAPPASSAA